MADLEEADFSDTIKVVDYVVFGSVLVASLAIGAFYGFFGGRNKTNEEFLMAGRSMGILPVTMSLLCSFVSANTLLGNPTEVYFYGIQITMQIFCFIPITLALAFLYVPVYFDLQLTSAYEYFEWRFSRKVRYTTSVFAMIHLIVYMPIVVLGPSLALDQVAGINFRLTSALIFIVCILYSSVGGLKAVLWTDALQAVVMFLALSMIIGLGLKEVGGIDLVWQRAKDAQRMDWINLDPDLRTRHTTWTSIVAGYFQWLPLFAATQSQIQRYNSVPSLSASRKTLLFNMFGMWLVIALCSLVGLIVFGHYYNCDPWNLKRVQSVDQILPLFVLEVLGGYSGVPGLVIAGLACGSLSTVSSALNSLTAIITEDFVKTYKPGLSEERLGFISKCISGSTGLLAFALIFIVAIINESVPVNPFSTLLHGSMLGPILAGFSFGMFFPWASDMGTFLGLLGGVSFSAFIGVGSIVASVENLAPNQRLNLTTEGCDIFINSTESGQVYSNEFWKQEHADDSIPVKMFSIAYLWQPGVGFISTFICGTIFNVIIYFLNRHKKARPPKVNIKLLSKPFMRLWIWIFGREAMEEIVDFEPFDFGGKCAIANEVRKMSRVSQSHEMKQRPSSVINVEIPVIKFNGTKSLASDDPSNNKRLSTQSFKKIDEF